MSEAFVKNEELKLILKVSPEKVCAFAGKNTKIPGVIILQMIENMGQHGIGGVLITGKIMTLLRGKMLVKNMLEQFLACVFEEVIPGLKMGVKGASAYIGPVNDILNGNRILYAPVSGRIGGTAVLDRFSVCASCLYLLGA